MSEYQWYEFLSLDAPLTEKQIAELRRLSSRAEISKGRFWNEYQFGDFKGDPSKLMEQYFDAHLYFASWGSRRLMLRLPLARLDEQALAPYVRGKSAPARLSGKHLLFELGSDSEGEDDDDDAESALVQIVPVRAELMRGDLRVAYLAWLSTVQGGEIKDAAKEPPVPPGLAALTPAQDAMADFLRLEEGLLAAAAEGTAALVDESAELVSWTAALSSQEKDAWLRRAVDQPDLALGADLLRTFRAQRAPEETARLRTAGELRKRAEVLEEGYERAEEARDAERERAAAVAKRKRLDELSAQGERAWTRLEKLLTRGENDEAAALGLGLRDLAQRQGDAVAFKLRFEALRKRCGGRAFLTRWNRAVRA